MVAGVIEKEVEQHSAAIAEWSARETDEAEEASELKLSGMDTTTDAFEPGVEVAEMTPTCGSEAQDEFLLVAKHSLNPRHRGEHDHKSGGKCEQQDLRR